MAFPRLFPFTTRSTGNSAEVATDASSYFPIQVMATTGSVLTARFVNGTASALASGTTSGSAASIVLYKNASGTGSIIGTFNGSGTAVATLGTATLLTSGTAGSANGSFVNGDLLIGEFRGGVASVVGAGAYIAVEYDYARETGAAPTAATGPA